MYRYGILAGLELGICLLIGMVNALIVDAIVEGVIFWLVFFGIRSYVGGIHLKKYAHCLIFSSLVNVCVLIFAKYFAPKNGLSCLLILVIGMGMILSPKIFRKGRTDESERYFRYKLERRIYFIIVSCFVIGLFNIKSVISTVTYSLFIIAISSTAQFIKNQSMITGVVDK